MTDRPQPTADDLALAREIVNLLLYHPLPRRPCHAVEADIATLIAKHRPPPPAMPAPTVAGWYECRHIHGKCFGVHWFSGSLLSRYKDNCGWECCSLGDYTDFRLLTYATPPAMTLEEQMAEIDEKFATTPGVKVGPSKKLFTAKAPKGPMS